MCQEQDAKRQKVSEWLVRPVITTVATNEPLLADKVDVSVSHSIGSFCFGSEIPRDMSQGKSPRALQFNLNSAQAKVSPSATTVRTQVNSSPSSLSLTSSQSTIRFEYTTGGFALSLSPSLSPPLLFPPQ